MTAGIPGIGLGGLFFVISALLMVAVELFRTVRGRSSLARWRFVGRQAGIALGIVLTTTAALWSLELAVPGEPLGARVDAGQSVGGVDRGSELLVAAIGVLPLSAAPILGTLLFLVFVLCFAEALRLVVRRPAASVSEAPARAIRRTRGLLDSASGVSPMGTARAAETTKSETAATTADCNL